MLYALLTAVIFLAAPALVRADVDQLLNDVEAAKRARICERAYGFLGISGPKVRVEEVRPEMKDNKFPMASAIPGYKPGEAIYIGIGNHSDYPIGRHHWYVNVGPVHASRKGMMGETVVSNGKVGLNGVLFEIPLPPEVMARLRERAKRGKFGGKASCLHAVCSLLEKEGVVIHHRNGETKVRVKAVLANLMEGKVKIEGKDADPETIRLLSTGEDELSHLLGVGMHADQKAKDSAIFYVGIGGSAVLMVGGFAGGVVYKNLREPEKKPSYRPLGNSDD